MRRNQWTVVAVLLSGLLCPRLAGAGDAQLVAPGSSAGTGASLGILTEDDYSREKVQQKWNDTVKAGMDEMERCASGCLKAPEETYPTPMTETTGAAVPESLGDTTKKLGDLTGSSTLGNIGGVTKAIQSNRECYKSGDREVCKDASANTIKGAGSAADLAKDLVKDSGKLSKAATHLGVAGDLAGIANKVDTAVGCYERGDTDGGLKAAVAAAEGVCDMVLKVVYPPLGVLKERADAACSLATGEDSCFASVVEGNARVAEETGCIITPTGTVICDDRLKDKKTDRANAFKTTLESNEQAKREAEEAARQRAAVQAAAMQRASEEDTYMDMLRYSTQMYSEQMRQQSLIRQQQQLEQQKKAEMEQRQMQIDQQNRLLIQQQQEQQQRERQQREQQQREQQPDSCSHPGHIPEVHKNCR